MDTHKLAWAAGLFDGEGTVGTRSNGQPHIRRTVVNVGQKDREVLDRFHAAVGVGHVWPLRSGMHCWETSARGDVHLVMWLLWTWLGSVKRQQFDRACELYHSWPTTSGGGQHH